MAQSFPYISSQTGLRQTLSHLRKTFPRTIDADTLKSLGLAPGNESFVISIMQFLQLIDANGNRQEESIKPFFAGSDEEFAAGFKKLVAQAYAKLFDSFGDDAWNENVDRLTTFFRQQDSATHLIGQRKAQTFRTLAQFSGEMPLPSGEQVATSSKTIRKPKSRTKFEKKKNVQAPAVNANRADSLALSVRIELNLPEAADEST